MLLTNHANINAYIHDVNKTCLHANMLRNADNGSRPLSHSFARSPGTVENAFAGGRWQTKLLRKQKLAERDGPASTSGHRHMAAAVPDEARGGPGVALELSAVAPPWWPVPD